MIHKFMIIKKNIKLYKIIGNGKKKHLKTSKVYPNQLEIEAKSLIEKSK